MTGNAKQFYKVGDAVEQLDAVGNVKDQGVVTRIEELDKISDRVWCKWESYENEQYFRIDDTTFKYRLVKSANTPDTQVPTERVSKELVKEVLQAYYKYQLYLGDVPECVVAPIFKIINKEHVKNMQEFKDFMQQYEKFKDYI